jgi:elongation factor 1 alpha-like protein
VRSIERDSNPCSIARAGDNVAVNLQGIDGYQLIPGGVLCHPGFPVTVAKKMELKILVLDITVPILVGSQVKICPNLCLISFSKHIITSFCT